MSASRFGGMFGVWLAGWLGMAVAMAAPLPFEDGFEAGASGMLLEGASAMLAQEALIAYGPHAAKGADIQDDVLLTRLDAVIAPGATVSQVNAALAAEQASIVAMRPGLPLLTLRVPRQSELAGLKKVAERLRASSVFVGVQVARQAPVTSLPPVAPGDTTHRQRLAHLLAGRFPAAWNVSRLATADCESRRVHVIVPDYYHPEAPASVRAVASEIGDPLIDYSAGIDAYEDDDPTTITSSHGYNMLGVLASRFDAVNGTGAIPFPQCLDLDPISDRGMSQNDEWLVLEGELQHEGKAIVSRSKGYLIPSCPESAPCDPSHFEDAQENLEEMAQSALRLARVIEPYRDNVLIMNSAGNEADDPETSIYPGYGEATLGAEPNLLASLSLMTLTLDAGMRYWLTSEEYWNPTPGHAEFPSLRMSEERLQALSQFRVALGLPPRLDLLPIVRVGAGNVTDEPEQMQRSPYSNHFPDVSAAVDPIHFIDRMAAWGGTSSAAPQVAGLAAYLWLISPELRALPAVVTRQAIVENPTYNFIWPIDAYASVLSTDRDVLPTPSDAPVRLALLDLDEDGDFDEADVENFLLRFQMPDAPNTPSYGREDLNGDGMVGGEGQSRFDLDRVGSVRFGRTDYSTIPQWIEGQLVNFKEYVLTDVQILCYYAYSALYTGDMGVRTSMFGDACVVGVGPEVAIDFAVSQAVISGDTAFMLELNYPARAGDEDYRLHRMNLRTSQVFGPEKIHAEGTVPEGLLLTNAQMPTPQGRSPVLATWYVRGPWEPVGDGSMSPRLHVWARYFDPAAQAWEEPIELGSFLDRHTSLPSLDMAVDARGNAMVLWVPPITPDDSLRRATYSYRSATSGQWSAPVAGVPNYSSDYAIAAGNGAITMVWSPYVDANGSTDFRLRAWRFEVATAAWGEESILSIGYSPKFTLGMDAQGGAVAMWYDGNVEYVSNYSPISGWAVPLSLGAVNPQANLPTRLSLDAAGNAVLHSRVGQEYVYSAFDVASRSWSSPRRSAGYFSDAPMLGRYGGYTVARQPSAANTAVLAMSPYSRGEGYLPAVTLASYEAREAEVRPVSAMGADGRGVVVWQALKRQDGDGFLREVIARRAKVIAPMPRR